MITGNRGEWSEIYALFKLLSDKQLFLGDKDLKKLEGIVYPIIKILRSEKHGNLEYSIKDQIVVVNDGVKVLTISIDEFKKKSELLLKVIKESKERTFAIPEIEEFMKSISCLTLKANSYTKTDITIVVHDQRTNQQPVLGFSIKSQLGNPSTLLNAGRTTNFIYKVEGIDFSQAKKINEIQTRSKIRDRIVAIENQKGSLVFLKNENQIFSNNLVLIDSLLPELLAGLVLDFYSSDYSSVADLVNNISKLNPIGYDNKDEHKFYEYKVKRFLTDIALGMKPSIVWTGTYNATGGYLVVKENGDVLCYHIYNRNQFEDYLLNNTKFDTPSSTRHGFGEIYEEDEKLYLKLNLQIRFKK